MPSLTLVLLEASLRCYALGAVAALLFVRQERAANAAAFGCATAGSALGLISALMTLSGAPIPAARSVQLWPSLIPYVRFSIQVDGLGAFFVLIVSVLGLALSLYSMGYACGRSWPCPPTVS
jgi:hydrogenase-4 component B